MSPCCAGVMGCRTPHPPSLSLGHAGGSPDLGLPGIGEEVGRMQPYSVSRVVLV